MFVILNVSGKYRKFESNIFSRQGAMANHIAHFLGHRNDGLKIAELYSIYSVADMDTDAFDAAFFDAFQNVVGGNGLSLPSRNNAVICYGVRPTGWSCSRKF